MMKNLAFLLSLSVLSACSLWSSGSQNGVPEPDYARFVNNVTIVSQSSTHVTYEYKNIRVDELAVLAALYCNDQTSKQAYLDKIVLQPDHARRAVFICKPQP